MNCELLEPGEGALTGRVVGGRGDGMHFLVMTEKTQGEVACPSVFSQVVISEWQFSTYCNS